MSARVDGLVGLRNVSWRRFSFTPIAINTVDKQNALEFHALDTMWQPELELT